MMDEIKLIDIKGFAKQLAYSGDVQQAEFFDDFFSELKICCKTSDNHENQLCYISEKIKYKSRFIETTESINDFLKLRLEEEAKP